jgi:hypothetical protein
MSDSTTPTNKDQAENTPVALEETSTPKNGTSTIE